jgi:hypothetical protein
MISTQSKSFFFEQAKRDNIYIYMMNQKSPQHKECQEKLQSDHKSVNTREICQSTVQKH